MPTTINLTIRATNVEHFTYNALIEKPLATSSASITLMLLNAFMQTNYRMISNATLPILSAYDPRLNGASVMLPIPPSHIKSPFTIKASETIVSVFHNLTIDDGTKVQDFMYWLESIAESDPELAENIRKGFEIYCTYNKPENDKLFTYDMRLEITHEEGGHIIAATLNPRVKPGLLSWLWDESPTKDVVGGAVCTDGPLTYIKSCTDRADFAQMHAAPTPKPR